MPSNDQIRKVRWLPVIIVASALILSSGATVFLALSGMPRAFAVVVALCSAVALVDLAAITTSRSKPR
jgi:hypothetical protein